MTTQDAAKALTYQERCVVERQVESIRPASAGGGYSSKSVGEAVDSIVSMFLKRESAAIEQATQAERERCAGIVDYWLGSGDVVADLIRSPAQEGAQPAPSKATAVGREGWTTTEELARYRKFTSTSLVGIGGPLLAALLDEIEHYRSGQSGEAAVTADAEGFPGGKRRGGDRRKWPWKFKEGGKRKGGDGRRSWDFMGPDAVEYRRADRDAILKKSQAEA